METARASQRTFRVFACCLLSAFWPATLSPAIPTTQAPQLQIVGAAAQAAIDPDDLGRFLTATRLAQAEPRSLFAPFGSALASADLYLLNTTADPVRVDLVARDRAGADYHLGIFEVEGARRLQVDIQALVSAWPQALDLGSLRAEYLGDAETLQGWLVADLGAGERELALVDPADFASNDLWTFFAEPVSVAVANVGDLPLEVRVQRGEGTRLRGEWRRWLEPGAVWQVAPTSGPPRGWLHVVQSGLPGEVLVSAWGAAGRLTWNPLETFGQQEDWVSLPAEPRDRPELAIWNSLDRRQTVQIEAVAAATGQLVERRTIILEGREVQVLSAGSLPGWGGSHRVAVRWRVRGLGGGLGVRGTLSRTQRELPVFARNEAHGGGTYPLPDLERYETKAILVNLAEQDSQVVAQLYWDGGTYAHGPVVVPAGQTVHISLDEIAARQAPDLLGRSVPAALPNGVLKWTVSRGPRQLLGRTEATDRESGDTVGFNCFGCCWQLPGLQIIPSLIKLAQGQSGSMEACVTFNTCSGNMGPFPTTPSLLIVPPPLIWDGQTVSATSPADGNVEFESYEEEIRVNCTTVLRKGRSRGRAEFCQKTFNPRDYDANKTCVEQINAGSPLRCTECRACCENVYQMKICQKARADIALGELNACKQTCNIDLDCNPPI